MFAIRLVPDHDLVIDTVGVRAPLVLSFVVLHDKALFRQCSSSQLRKRLVGKRHDETLRCVALSVVNCRIDCFRDSG
jgi:hypothetical protein